jgi:hypothetical protein
VARPTDRSVFSARDGMAKKVSGGGHRDTHQSELDELILDSTAFNRIAMTVVVLCLRKGEEFEGIIIETP